MNTTTTAPAAHTAEQIARRILADNGTTDPHPALLADTIREVEYHGATMPAEVEEPAAGWTVERTDYEIACDHIACDTMHRRLYNADRAGTELVELYNMNGDIIGRRWETRLHVRTVRQWSVVNPAGFAEESYDTKRDALAALARMSR